MSWSTIGFFVFAASFISIAACGVWMAVRLNVMRRRVDAMTAMRALPALSGLTEQVDRIDGSLQRLGPVGARFAAARRNVAAAFEAGARLAVDVRLVADATQDLLESLVPSLRGCSAPRP